MNKSNVSLYTQWELKVKMGIKIFNVNCPGIVLFDIMMTWVRWCFPQMIPVTSKLP